MKSNRIRMTALFSAVLLAASLSACSDSAPKAVDTSASAESSAASASPETAGADAEASETANDASAAGTTYAPEDIDLDLTTLSSTMVYSEVYNMMNAPENYVGKTVKMNGQFVLYEDEETNKTYYSCIIQDATACCAQGIEFIPDDSYTYPDDYPEEDSEITVTGIFDTYTEDGAVFCTLREAQL